MTEEKNTAVSEAVKPKAMSNSQKMVLRSINNGARQDPLAMINIDEEYSLILAKKSKLSANQRKAVVEQYEKAMTPTEEKAGFKSIKKKDSGMASEGTDVDTSVVEYIPVKEALLNHMQRGKEQCGVDAEVVA